MSFLFEADEHGRVSVREPDARFARWETSLVEEVDVLVGEDGAQTIKVRRGARVAIDDPGGIGGATLYGTVAGIMGGDPLYFNGLSSLGIDAEPSDALRAIAVKIRESLCDLSWGTDSTWASALAGEGGLAIFSGDGIAFAARAGKFRLAPRRVSFCDGRSAQEGRLKASPWAINFAAPEAEVKRDLDDLARVHHADRARAPCEGESYAAYRARIAVEPPYAFTLDPDWPHPHDLTWWRSHDR